MAWACFASSQGISGPDTYPQFRNVSGLPGGGFGVDRFGRFNFRGAMALSTPIGYSLAEGEWAIGICSMSDGIFVELPSGSGEGIETANGTGFLMRGFSLAAGRLAIGGMLLSSHGDTVLNLNWQLPDFSDKVGISIGVQDATSSGGSAGEGWPTDGDSSRSLYAAGTMELHEGLHGTVGVGSRRLKGFFGSLSWSVHDKIKLVGEYDTFAWNATAAFDLSREQDRVHVTAGVGVIRGRNLFLFASAGF